MSIIKDMSNVPYSHKEDEINPYLEAFDIDNDNIDFDVLDTYKNSEYVFNQNALDDIKDEIDVMQDNWNNDIDNDLANKNNTFQQWIDNLGYEVVSWGVQWESETEKTPYVYRRSPQLAHEYNGERDKIIGGTIKWNQMIQNGNFANLNNWTRNYLSSYSVSNNVYHFVGNEDGEGLCGISQSITLKKSHYYLITVDVKSTTPTTDYNSTFSILLDTDYVGYVAYTGQWQKYSVVHFCRDAGTYDLKLFDGRNYEETPFEEILLRNAMVIDITEMFRSTSIGNYIDTLEEDTAGSGIAKLQEWGLDINSYHAYDSGSLQSVNVSAHETVGKNLLPMTVNGIKAINTSGVWTDNNYSYNGVTFTIHTDEDNNVTGIEANGTATGNINFRVVSYTNPTNAQIDLFGNKKINGTPSGGSSSRYYESLSIINSGTVTTGMDTGSGANIWDLSSYYGATQIYLSITIKNGYTASNLLFKPMLRFMSVSDNTFEPYIKHLYPLDESVTLNGAFLLDANHNLYANGDIYESDGNVSRRSVTIDLSTVQWTQEGAYFITELPYGGTSTNVEPFVICEKYIESHSADAIADTFTCEINVAHTLLRLQIRTTTTPSGACIYTPGTITTEQADPFEFVQSVSPYGTEKYIDYGVSQGTRNIAVPVGHETVYVQQASATTNYSKNNMVTYANDYGALFLCLNDCDVTVPLPTKDNPINNYWVRLYPVGYASYNLSLAFWSAGNEYTIGNLVWIEEGDVNFYVCIEPTSSVDVLPPSDDTTHWAKLFTIRRDKFAIYDSMPNQTFFDNDYSPSVFGVIQSNGTSIKIVDRIHSESASNPTYLNLKQNSTGIRLPNQNNNIYVSLNNLLSKYNIGKNYFLGG